MRRTKAIPEGVISLANQPFSFAISPISTRPQSGDPAAQLHMFVHGAFLSPVTHTDYLAHVTRAG
jgi:hypothetical protein